jgi:hypothetical protein
MGKCKQWEEIDSMIADELLKLKNNSDLFFSQGGFRSGAEQRVYSIAATAIKDSVLSISSNEYLFDLFESDIVLRVPIINIPSPFQSQERDFLIINIEVDGIHHKQENKKRFFMLRDEYLKSQGVVIERIEVSTLKRKKDKEVKEWIQEKVTEARTYGVKDG